MSSSLSRLAVVLCLLLTAWPVRAADPALDRIEQVLAGFDHVDLAFEQYVHGVEGELVEFATGRFIMQRPKFRWVVDDPYPQVIVSDGTLLRVYDPDLEQVSERALATALEGTPLGILSRRDGRIRDQFQLLSHDVRDGEEYFMLVPVVPKGKTPEDVTDGESATTQGKAQRIELWLAAGTLKRLDVMDEFGGRLRLEFKPTADTPPPAEPFVLTVPEGTEVIPG